MMKYCKLFLILFIFCLLVAPLLHIDTSEVSTLENRRLKVFPKIEENGTFNYNFGTEFDGWLGDRFWKRNELIAGSTYLRYLLAKNYSKNGVIEGKDGWLFEERVKRIPTSTDIKALKKLKKFCDKNGIKLFVIISPKSYDIYPEYYPEETDTTIPWHTHFHKFYKLGFPVVESVESMKKAKSGDKLFFKKDHHWTDLGASVAYQDFVKELQKVYPDFPSYNPLDFEVSYLDQRYSYKRNETSVNSLCKKWGIDYPLLCASEQYPYYQHKCNVKKEVIEQPLKYHKYTNKNGYPLKVFLIGKSQSFILEIFFRAYIKELLRIDMNNLFNKRTPSIEPYLPLIKEEHPEVLVLLLASTYLLTDFNEDGPVDNK